MEIAAFADDTTILAPYKDYVTAAISYLQTAIDAISI